MCKLSQRIAATQLNCPRLQPLATRLRPLLVRICLILILFGKRDLNKLALARLEGRLKKTLDEFGLTINTFLLNAQEPDDFDDSPVRVVHQGEHYRRRGKTPKIIATLFGQFQLRRQLYEAYEAGVAAIHPYIIMLGLVAGVATPMLAGKVGDWRRPAPSRPPYTHCRPSIMSSGLSGF